MAEPSAAKLYSPTLLALSASLADYPYRDSFHAYAEAHSRTCGSTIKVGLSADQVGHVSSIGMQVAACAVGQSSAAILAKSIMGQSLGDLGKAKAQIETWLASGGDRPEWPGIEALEPALPYPGRREAILLPWRAAIDALSSLVSSR